jgi:hypothetical protein
MESVNFQQTAIVSIPNKLPNFDILEEICPMPTAQ